MSLGRDTLSSRSWRRLCGLPPTKYSCVWDKHRAFGAREPVTRLAQVASRLKSKAPAKQRVVAQSGRPDLNRGPHRPELRVDTTVRRGNPLDFGTFQVRGDSSYHARSRLIGGGLGAGSRPVPKRAGRRSSICVPRKQQRDMDSSDASSSSVGGVSGVVTETLASIREGGSLAARVDTAALSAEQTRSAGSPAEQLRRAARGAQTGRRQRAPFRARSTSARTRQPAR